MNEYMAKANPNVVKIQPFFKPKALPVKKSSTANGHPQKFVTQMDFYKNASKRTNNK